MPGKKPKRKWSRDRDLHSSISRKRREITPNAYSKRQWKNVDRKTLACLKAVHGFKGKKMVWGKGKKGGPVEMVFEPVPGYKSVSRIEHGYSEVNPLFEFKPADFMYGFREWLGMPVRFMAFPTKPELRKNRPLNWLGSLAWPQDFVMDARGALGYVGGTVTIAGKEKRPTMFIQCIEVRGEYYRMTNTKYVKDPKDRRERKQIQRRFEGWYKKWVAEVENQCRALGFERVAILPSTSPFFRKGDVKINPETKKAFYRDLPERTGYAKETLSIPTTEGMKRVRYYAKRLN